MQLLPSVHTGHFQHFLEEGGILAGQPGLPLGGHFGHLIVFGIGFVIFLLLAFRLAYKEYRRTGRWQLPK